MGAYCVPGISSGSGDRNVCKTNMWSQVAYSLVGKAENKQITQIKHKLQ